MRELADARRLQVVPGVTASLDTAIEAYRAARQVYEATGNENGLASLTQAMGMTYARGRQYAEAESCFQESLAYASAVVAGRARHGRLKAYSLRRLADLRRDQGDLDQAVDYYEKCINACQIDVDDPTCQARALSICGLTQSQRNQLSAARAQLSAALALFAQRPLGRLDHEAQVAATWLQRLEDH
jgi:tetratricopeptide (TPR) repeat protein